MDPVQPPVTQIPTASSTPPPSMTPPVMKPPPSGKSLDMKKVLWVFLALFFVVGSILAVNWEYGMKYGGKSQNVQTAGIQAAVPTPVLDPTATWKTYTDTANGYLIKYPSEWFLQECPTDPTCTKDDAHVYFRTIDPNNPPPSSAIPHFAWISYYAVPDGKELTDVLTQGASVDEKSNFTLQEEMINNMTVFKTSSVPSQADSEWIFFKKNAGEYIAVAFTPSVQTASDDAALKQEHENYYNAFTQMIKTFQFVENISVTPSTSPTEGTACTLEAKQCADGSYVSRSGPTCEFAACPK